MLLLIFLGSILVLISKFFRYYTRRLKDKYHIQKGKVSYSDLSDSGSVLFSKKYRISGKPDYIVNENGKMIPVEFKTGSYSYPLKNHVFQLAAYCHLVEENYGGFVPFGVLVYDQVSEHRVSFDPCLRFELESTIKEMRSVLKTGRIVLNHSNSGRCKGCSMKGFCKNKFL